jgi:hypothetical protein
VIGHGGKTEIATALRRIYLDAREDIAPLHKHVESGAWFRTRQLVFRLIGHYRCVVKEVI